jgi:hypothetical protein
VVFGENHLYGQDGVFTHYYSESKRYIIMTIQISRKGKAFILVVIAIVAAIGITMALLPKTETINPPDHIEQNYIVTLDNLSPSSETGIITLTWQSEEVPGTWIYRSNHEFTTQSGAAIIAAFVEPGHYTYTDIVSVDGIYFYAIGVRTYADTTGLSNVVSVTVTFPYVAIAPVAVLVTPATSTDGIVHIAWTKSPQAVRYDVYRSDNYIHTFADAAFLTSILSSAVSEGDDFSPGIPAPLFRYTDQINFPGVYYYIVVAINSEGTQSAISNTWNNNVVINVPVSDVIAYWQLKIQSYIAFSQSAISFSLSSFSSPSMLGILGELKIYQITDYDVKGVMETGVELINYKACTQSGVYTISANGLCALTFIGPNWYLYVRPGG